MGESAVLFHSYLFAAPLSRHEAHERIAEAKKAKQQVQPESVAVLLNTLETLTKDEVKEEERGETELVLCGEELVSSIEKDEEEPKRTKKENHAEDESSSVEEERKSVTKNSSLFRSEAPDKAMELVVTRKTSENLMKNNEKPVRQRFSLLKLFMGNTKTQRQNSKRKSDKKPNKPFLCLCFNPDMKDLSSDSEYGSKIESFECTVAKHKTGTPR
ncbi:hypothetical protein YC2023_053952 [Brassica napus]